MTLKYEWGVEYECNGVRPDLPGYIIIECKDKFGKPYRRKRYLNWWDFRFVSVFRIVDKRYKPCENTAGGGKVPKVPFKTGGFIDQAINAEAKRINESLYTNTLQPTITNKYHREITGIDGTRTVIDVYRVLRAFPTGLPEIDHAVKKLLAPGMRGSKDQITDLREAAQSIECAIKYLEQTVNAE